MQLRDATLPCIDLLQTIKRLVQFCSLLNVLVRDRRDAFDIYAMLMPGTRTVNQEPPQCVCGHHEEVAAVRLTQLVGGEQTRVQLLEQFSRLCSIISPRGDRGDAT